MDKEHKLRRAAIREQSRLKDHYRRRNLGRKIKRLNEAKAKQYGLWDDGDYDGLPEENSALSTTAPM